MREKEPSTKIIYVRHGSTDFPTDRLYCDDREDPDLNPQGQQQAQATAQLIQGFNIAAVYSSPAQRCMQTARILAADLSDKIVSMDELKERHFGIWEGLYFHEIQQQYPQEYAQWKKDPARFTPRQGENLYDLNARLNGSISHISKTNIGNTVLIISHVGPIRVCVAHALQMPMEMTRQLCIDYASLTRIDYGKQKINLMYFNYLSLLRET